VDSLAFGKASSVIELSGPPLKSFTMVQSLMCGAVRVALGDQVADAPVTTSAIVVGMVAQRLAPAADAAVAGGGAGGGEAPAASLIIGPYACLLAGPLGPGMFGVKASAVDFGAPLGVSKGSELCYTAFHVLSRYLTLPINQRKGYVVLDCVSLGLDWTAFRLNAGYWQHRFALFAKVLFLLTYNIDKVQVCTAAAHHILVHILRTVCTRVHLHVDVVEAGGNDNATITVVAVFNGRGRLFSLCFHPTAQRNGARKVMAFVSQAVHDLYAGIGQCAGLGGV
jgi:hypothetical protein